MDKVFELYKNFNKNDEKKLQKHLSARFSNQTIPLLLHKDILQQKSIVTLKDLFEKHRHRYKTLNALKKNATILKSEVEKYLLDNRITEKNIYDKIALLGYYLKNQNLKNFNSLNAELEKNWKNYTYEQQLAILDLRLEYASNHEKGGSIGDKFIGYLKQKNELQNKQILKFKLEQLSFDSLYAPYGKTSGVKWAEIVNDAPEIFNKGIELLYYKIYSLQKKFSNNEAKEVVEYFDQLFDSLSLTEISWARFFLGNLLNKHHNLSQGDYSLSVHLAYQQFIYKRLFRSKWEFTVVNPQLYRAMFYSALRARDEKWCQRLLHEDIKILPAADRAFVEAHCKMLQYFWQNNYELLWKAVLNFKPKSEFDKATLKCYQMICLYEHNQIDTLYDMLRSEILRLKREKYLASVRLSFLKFIDTLKVIISKPSLTQKEKNDVVNKLRSGVMPFGFKWLLEKFGEELN
jgi:hypothetical protein